MAFHCRRSLDHLIHVWQLGTKDPEGKLNSNYAHCVLFHPILPRYLPNTRLRLAESFALFGMHCPLPQKGGWGGGISGIVLFWRQWSRSIWCEMRVLVRCLAAGAGAVYTRRLHNNWQLGSKRSRGMAALPGLSQCQAWGWRAGPYASLAKPAPGRQFCYCISVI